MSVFSWHLLDNGIFDIEAARLYTAATNPLFPMEYHGYPKVPVKHEGRRLRENARVHETEPESYEAAQKVEPCRQMKQRQADETPLATIGDVLDAALTPLPACPTTPVRSGSQADAMASCLRERQLRDSAERRLVEHYSALTVPELRHLVGNGDHLAEFVLARAYRSNGYERDTYLPILHAAMQNGVQHALSLYGFELWLAGGQEETLGMIREAAAHGCGEGAFLLYLELKGGKAAARGLEFLKLAAKCSFIPACKELSRLYDYGGLVNADIAMSAKWMKRAADLGDVDAMYRYACKMTGIIPHFTRNRLNEARSYFRKAMERGHIEAAFRLARMYCTCCTKWSGGRLFPGSSMSYSRGEYDYSFYDMDSAAVRIYLKLAAMSPEMMERVYRERVNIRGYNVDDLLKGLAALGHADSMFLLGKMSLSRYSGRMNPDTLYWYRRAAEHGHREAIASLRRNGQEFPPV